MRFEILKIAAAQNGGVCFRIQNYNLSKDQQLQILQIGLAQIVSKALETNYFLLLEKFANTQKVSSTQKLFEAVAQTCVLQIPHLETEEAQKVKKTLKETFEQLKDFALQSGASDKVLASLEETIFTKHTSLLQQQKDLLWLGSWMMHYSFNPVEKCPLADEAMLPLLNSILNTFDANLRNQATSAMTSIYKDHVKIESLKILMAADERLHLIVLFSTTIGFEAEMTKKICDELYPSRKDAKMMTPINGLMGALYKSNLSSEEKEQLLKMIFNPPVKGDRERQNEYKERLSQYRKSQQHWIAAVHSLLAFGQEEILKNVTATTLIKEWQTFMVKTFNIRDDLLDKFFPTFGQSKRYPNGIIIYAARLQTLPKEERDILMPLLGKLINSVLDGTFPQMRYSFTDNKHLETLFSKSEELLKKWQTSLPIKIDNLTSYTIEDTDHWEDLELMGTEVDGSCQNIHRDPAFNLCLLSSFLDGKIRLMVARDKAGKIIGRVILRILQGVNNKPVLFMEQLYTRNGVNEKLIHEHILEGCMQKAQSMGIALAASSEDYSDFYAKYPGTLQSLGGPAPYEYVDALRDIQQNGVYSIPESCLLWSP